MHIPDLYIHAGSVLSVCHSTTREEDGLSQKLPEIPFLQISGDRSVKTDDYILPNWAIWFNNDTFE